MTTSEQPEKADNEKSAGIIQSRLLEIGKQHLQSIRDQMVDAMAAEFGITKKSIRADLKRMDETLRQHQETTRAAQLPQWQTRLIRGENGLEWCFENAALMLEHDEDWEGRLRFNELTVRVELNGKPMEDHHYVGVLRWFNRRGLPRASKDIAYSAVDTVARQQAYHPVREYIGGLEWDGVERIEKFLKTHMGAADGEYHDAVSFRFFIGAVARAYQPGCKLDTMLVLEGAQGTFKSTAVEVLFGKAWFGDQLPPTNTKDASSYLKGLWCVEKAELQQMKKADWETTKAFMSRTVERYRKAYGRAEVEEPRTCCFVGTTNSTEYLGDPTGARQFWPVKCGFIELEKIKAERDQLWAEALYWFQRNEKWWLTKEEEMLAEEVRKDREINDPWFDPIAKELENKSAGDTVFVTDLLTNVLEIPTHQQHAHAMGRIGTILTRLGYEKGTRDQKRRRPWTKKGGQLDLEL